MGLRGKIILVVGGAGFVGSNLVKTLLQKNIKRIDIVDNLLSSDKDNLPDDKKVFFTLGSVADERVLTGLKDTYDYIFHLATFHGNQNSIFDPLADHDNNLLTTLKLFNHAKRFKKLKKIVYASAGCSVAKKTAGKAIATTEEAPISLTLDSPYSISKIVGEFYANYFFKEYHLPVVKTRFQNVYGPGEVLGAGKWRGTVATIWRNVVPTFIYKALKGASLPVHNHGKATRDFIFVEDLVDGLLKAAVKGSPGEVYNLASGRQTSILQLARLINHITGNQTPLTYLPQRRWDTSIKRFGSTQKAKRYLGFAAKTSIEEGLAQTVRWTRENLDRIEWHIRKHEGKVETVHEL